MKIVFEKLFRMLNLDSNLTLIEKLTGGRMHDVWRVDNFVVKRLNHPGDYESTQRIAREFAGHGIPAVISIDHEKNSVIEIDNELFMVFPFVIGKHIKVTDMTLDNISSMGKLLRKMHQLQLSEPIAEPFKLYFEARDFGAYASPLIDSVIEKHHENPLPESMILSHRDLDHQNVLWSEVGLQVIDWDLAGLISPIADLLCTAFYWSILSETQFSLKNCRAFLRAYGPIDGLQDHFEGAFYWVLAYWLDWVLYNIKLGGAQQAREAAYCNHVILHLISIQDKIENVIKEQ